MKRLLSAFLVCLLLCMCSFPAYAGTMASPSNARKASSSNASKSPVKVASSSNASLNLMDSTVFDYADSGIMAASDDLPSVPNTVDLTKVRMELAFNNKLGDVSYEHKMLNSSGYFSLAKPTTFSSGLRYSLIINKGALPSVGNYVMSVRFSSNTGYDWKTISVYPRKASSNASALYGASKSVSFQQFSGDFYFNTVVEITSSTTDLYVRLIPDSFSFPVGGYFSIRFEPTTAAADVPGMPVNDGEVQSNISNGVDNISSGVDDISENTSTMVDQNNTIISGIANIIQTISNQLTAFWNQLAGEFTNLYNKMNDHHQEDLDKMDEQIENDNANTEYLANGYDNSGINADNDRLGASLNEYSDQENQVMEQVTSVLDDFSFELPDNKFLGTVKGICDFLQALYDNAGAFQVVINLSFMMSIASLVIGVYRFKSS